ncbi:FkbM family methyltransferase [Lentzea albidocapillata]|uniref:Methyltransferase, FkbM family n=1 Tax=Lentzea albidocapillata TaxID=40571 RepID=A0A1W2FHV8_9PSEU|nr:FkbM family methyltransferase [Lentzea albidocapillata]SMD21625.1 methyltransferase, FkbM family [Lentzea albidocapillata]
MPSVTACTVVAKNYLPAARVLARSYLDHHEGHRFVILVIDAPWGSIADEDGVQVLGPDATGIDELDYLRMATAYSLTELATAVKPYLLRQQREQSDVVMYIDPDIKVFAPMPELAELAMEHGIVLTPHFLEPLPRDGKEPSEAVIMGTGIFNLGFVATGPGSEPFLDFWAVRLRHDAIVAPERQLFTDQRWVDQVPALFRNHVLRDPGFNVAYWNLHERSVHKQDGKYFADGKPLRFFHFSGYRPEHPWLLTYHCQRRPRILLSENPDLKAICDDYGTALHTNGYAETLDAIPYGFNKMSDGSKLSPTMRGMFRDAWIKVEVEHERVSKQDTEIPPHAFGEDGGRAFREWLTSPATPGQAAAGLSRMIMAVFEARTDLQLAFPDVLGADADDFRAWCRTSGINEGMLPEWGLPTEPKPVREPVDEFGVNMLGYLTAELGLGEMGRIVHDAIELAGVPIVSVVEDRLVSNRTNVDHQGTLGEPKFPVSLVAVNADQTHAVLGHHPGVGHHRYRIGLWAWELEDFPEWLHSAFALVDEVWTVSDFCRDAIAKHSSVPVRTIPVPVRDPGEPDPVPTGGPAQFLFAFDFNSIGQRKNPWGAITAFQRAFEGRDDVRLVIKAINGKLHPLSAERLRVLASSDPRIELLERYLTVQELHDLYANSTAYVSLHRSEGFGLTVAEAMARALPVISTDYSSTTEFFDSRVGWPIPYELTEVGKGNFPYHETAVWADPDLDAAAQAMREIADDPAEARRRGLAAREYILRTRSMTAAATWMREQLTNAYEKWRSDRDTTAVQEQEADPLQPLRESKQALLWQPEAGAPSRLPGAPAMRKAVLRMIDHYDVHQRKVMGTLVGGVEGTAAQMLARMEAMEQALTTRLDEVTRNMAKSIERLENREPDLTGLQQEIAQVNARVGEDFAAVRESISGVRDQVEAAEQRHHEMFADRDVRIDQDERTLQQMKRDLTAVHTSARLSHAPVPDGAQVVLCDAGALLVPDDDVVLPWLEYHRSWEVSEADLMAELIGEGAFLDIGAHVGYHTLRLMQRTSATITAVAVEANPVNADYLQRNVAAVLPAEVAQRVTVLPIAAWDSNTEVVLVQEEEFNSGDHRVHENSGDGSTGGVVVPAVRLDGRPEVNGRRVSLVKVDLQGRDHRALAGLSDVLERDRPHVVCEFCPDAITELGDDAAEVLVTYRKLGYHVVPVDDNGPVTGDYSDEELITMADSAETKFITLWLRPL